MSSPSETQPRLGRSENVVNASGLWRIPSVMAASFAQTQESRDTLGRAVAGDRAALESIAREWWPQMRRWAVYQLGNVALAEDACQDALIRLVQSIESFDASRPFGPWLRSIVRNCCKKVHNRDTRHDHLGLSDALPGNQRSAELDLDRRRRARRAVAAFQELTERQREVMHLCLHGMSAAEAARSLHITPSTARVLLFRARQVLRTALEEGP